MARKIKGTDILTDDAIVKAERFVLACKKADKALIDLKKSYDNFQQVLKLK